MVAVVVAVVVTVVVAVVVVVVVVAVEERQKSFRQLIHSTDNAVMTAGRLCDTHLDEVFHLKFILILTCTAILNIFFN